MFGGAVDKSKAGGGVGMPVGGCVVLKEWWDFKQSQKEVREQTMQESAGGMVQEREALVLRLWGSRNSKGAPVDRQRQRRVGGALHPAVRVRRRKRPRFWAILARACTSASAPYVTYLGLFSSNLERVDHKGSLQRAKGDTNVKLPIAGHSTHQFPSSSPGYRAPLV